MIGWLIIIGMLGHERWAVREAATRICIEQGEVGRAIARAAMRSRDPEVRRRGERIEQEIVRATVGRCFPKGYPVWPCIDFLAGHCLDQYPICRGIDVESPLARAVVRHYLGRAAGYITTTARSSEWPQPSGGYATLSRRAVYGRCNRHNMAPMLKFRSSAQPFEQCSSAERV
jgi:hypothetical protein